jgi:hypothetical protein
VEFGLVAYVQFLLALNQSNRFAMAAVLGLNKYYPCGCIGQAFNGPEYSDRAYLLAAPVRTGGTMTDLFANCLPLVASASRGLYPIPGTNAYDNPQNIMANTAGSSYFGYLTNSSTAGTVQAAYNQNLRFAIVLPGLLGGGTNKLFPLFIGPTRISLFTDVQNNYLWFNFPPNPDIQTATPATPSVVGSVVIRSVYLNMDYIRCDGPSFSMILEGLPLPETFVIKSTAWATASVVVPASSGQAQTLIPHRRASCKCLYIMMSPNGGSFTQNTSAFSANGLNMTTSQTSTPGNIFGKFGSVNMNLTNGTCVENNGILYPQQMHDPLERPDEIYSVLLRTLGVWSNDGQRPSIATNNFMVTDRMSVPGASIGTSSQGEALWRSYQSLSARCCGDAFAGSSENSFSWYGTCTGPTVLGATFLNYTDHGAWNTTHPTQAQSTTAGTNASATNAFDTAWSYGPIAIYREGSMALSNYNTGLIHDSQSNYPLCAPEANQFIYAVDFENIAKNSYLSGVSSLNGSFFFRTNIKSQLTVPYTMYFILCFDMLTVLNYTHKTAYVKI